MSLTTATCLVIGDITFDVVAAAESDLPVVRRAGTDITFVGRTEQKIGGSGLLFARALSHGSSVHPLLVAGCGADSAGELVRLRLEKDGLSTGGLQQIQNADTCLVALMHTRDGTRFMIRPATHAGRCLTARQAVLFAEAEAGNCALFFISGYTLVHHPTPSSDTVAELAKWARAGGVPICLDLVPHEFRESVGTLDDVCALLGGTPDIVVAEHRTARGLGYSVATQPSEDEVSTTARRMSDRWDMIAVIQHQIRPGHYLQAAARGGRIVDVVGFPVDEHERTGLGDRLLVDFLVRADILAARA